MALPPYPKQHIFALSFVAVKDAACTFAEAESQNTSKRLHKRVAISYALHLRCRDTSYSGVFDVTSSVHRSFHVRIYGSHLPHMACVLVASASRPTSTIFLNHFAKKCKRNLSNHEKKLLVPIVTQKEVLKLLCFCFLLTKKYVQVLYKFSKSRISFLKTCSALAGGLPLTKYSKAKSIER